jgi:hypothetical protein
VKKASFNITVRFVLQLHLLRLASVGDYAIYSQKIDDYFFVKGKLALMPGQVMCGIWYARDFRRCWENIIPIAVLERSQLNRLLTEE